MINKILRYTVIYLVLLLLQVLIFNNIQFSGYINPYVYILFLLLLPYETPGWILLLVSFLGGLIIDLFTGTPGMHAAATLAAAFVRPYILISISPREGYKAETELTAAVYGFRWFVIYTLGMVFIHHLVLFYLEVFRLNDFFRTLARVILSSSFTAIIILMLEYLRKGR